MKDDINNTGTNTNMKTLIVKNFSGSFNDEYIGHEIINSFDFDGNNSGPRYYLFYVPPYGSIFSETDFFDNLNYKDGFDKIIVFEETEITNVLKLKSVVINPKPINEETYLRYLNKVKYGGKLLKDILFGSGSNDDPLKKPVKIYNFTYLVKQGNYYNFEDNNILIWHKSTPVRNKLKAKSIADAKKIYGKEPVVINDTPIGQYNHCYNVGTEFENWYEEKVEPYLGSHAWSLLTVGTTSKGIQSIYNDDNLIKNLNRISDENLYSNFIKTVLEQNQILKNDFFSFLVEKLHKIKGYQTSSANVSTQKQSLIEIKRALNSYLKNDSKKNLKRINTMIAKCPSEEIKNEVKKHIEEKSKFVNGYIDLYLEDDNYRIVIENKIYSGIGKHEGEQEEVTQIEVYRTYLNDLNKIDSKHQKTSSIIVLCPESEKNSFIDCGEDVVLTYKDLYEFFVNKKNLISRNCDDFLNAIAFHALSKEQIITARFLRILK